MDVVHPNILFRLMKIFCCVIVFACLSSAYGQKADTAIYLKTVEVYGMPLDRYAAGSKIEKIQAEGTTLTQSLGGLSPLYFKSYGNSQLSTIAFRGTSSSHTAVLWNGININAPTLGQSDFSTLPSFLFEDISVQYGTASSLYGSGALGGSILLNQTTPRFEKGMKVQLQQNAGSFGRYFTGGKINYSNGKWELRSKLFYHKLENNFSYYAPSIARSQTQQNASVKNYGIDQQAHLKISEKQRLSLEGMYTYNLRYIQPAVTNNDSQQTLEDKNARFNAGYQQDVNGGTLYTAIGYVWNNQLYNVSSRTRSSQINILCNVDKQIGSASSIRYGGNAAFIFANADNYPENLRQSRYDLFASVRHRFTSYWNVNINLRQSVYAKKYAPFAPSVGSDLTLVTTSDHKLLLRLQGSRGYRVPTLNDLYWNPGGNPNLKPEDSYQAEEGLNWTYQKGKHRLETDLTHYNTWVDQWIIWLPNDNGVWSPSNLQKVNVQGAEISSRYTLSIQKTIVKVGVNYSYVRSINKKGLNEFDHASINKQLPYVPVHAGNAVVKLLTHNWTAEVRAGYTGLRYITTDDDVNQAVKAYILTDAFITKQFDTKQMSFALRAEANNIFNLYYENLKNIAMPGRNFLITLTINFNTKSIL